MTLASILRRTSQFAIDHSPTILSSAGVIGAITTAYLAGKASFEAADIIRLKEGTEGTHGDALGRFKERAKLVWPLYVPAATTGIATVACIIAANQVGIRRAAGLAAATTIVEKSFEEYKSKVAEKFGERKEEQVRDEINQDRMARTLDDSDLAMFTIAEGKLCYDKFSDRYFRGSVEGIESAVNILNNDINHNGSATLGDLYRLLEMEAPAYSEQIGWNTDRLIEVRCGSALAHNSEPCIVMEFRNDPSPDYGRFRRI